MPLFAYSADDVRRAEEPLLAATPNGALMAQAAFGLATEVSRIVGRRDADDPRRALAVRGKKIALLVGTGNNGGDALWAGTYLAKRGAIVTAILCGTRSHPQGTVALQGTGGRLVQLDIPKKPATHPVLGIQQVSELILTQDAVLDGLLGIGARGALTGPSAELVTAISNGLEYSDLAVIAVDAPSGIDIDAGTIPGPVLPATHTVTFGVAKPGLWLPPASCLAGDVTVVDIGLRPELTKQRANPVVRMMTEADVRAWWPIPQPADHKYTRGVLGVAAGSEHYPGAAVLSVQGALATGIGMVRYLGPDTVARTVIERFPQVVGGTGRVQAWVVGSGVDASDSAQAGRTRQAMRSAVDDGIPMIIDAGALTLLDETLTTPAVLTPHAGEMAALCTRLGTSVTREEIEANPTQWAVSVASQLGATVLLKGATTIVAAPDGTVRAVSEATGWLATAGAGDVLGGVIGALAATRADAIAADPTALADVAALGAWIHGRAARQAAHVDRVPGGPFLIEGLCSSIVSVIRETLAGCDG